MCSIERAVHIKGRSTSHTATDDVVRSQQANHPASHPASSSSSPLPTIRIQQATISPSQQFEFPTDATPTSNPTMPAMIPGSVAHSQEKQGLPAKSIAGLAMIPVGVVLIAVAVFSFFWLRKRRRRSPIIQHLGPARPPMVPEKDFRSPSSSFDTTTSGGKVRSMSAMSIPVVHTSWVVSPRSQARPSNDSFVRHNPWSDQLPKISEDITTAGLQVSRGTDSGNDSPIDRSSPFRLKRGDTRKRSSLDPDVMCSWPVPPQRAVQAAPLQAPRTEKTYMERRSISAEYFAQEKDSRNAHGAQDYWEDIRLELGPDPGPTITSH